MPKINFMISAVARVWSLKLHSASAVFALEIISEKGRLLGFGSPPYSSDGEYREFLLEGDGSGFCEKYSEELEPLENFLLGLARDGDLVVSKEGRVVRAIGAAKSAEAGEAAETEVSERTIIFLAAAAWLVYRFRMNLGLQPLCTGSFFGALCSEVYADRVGLSLLLFREKGTLGSFLDTWAGRGLKTRPMFRDLPAVFLAKIENYVIPPPESEIEIHTKCAALGDSWGFRSMASVMRLEDGREKHCGHYSSTAILNKCAVLDFLLPGRPILYSVAMIMANNGISFFSFSGLVGSLDLAAIIFQCVWGMMAMNSVGLAHMDLHPGNYTLRLDVETLADFTSKAELEAYLCWVGPGSRIYLLESGGVKKYYYLPVRRYSVGIIDYSRAAELGGEGESDVDDMLVHDYRFFFGALRNMVGPNELCDKADKIINHYEEAADKATDKAASESAADGELADKAGDTAGAAVSETKQKKYTGLGLSILSGLFDEIYAKQEPGAAAIPAARPMKLI